MFIDLLLMNEHHFCDVGIFLLLTVKSIQSFFHCMGSSTMSCIDVILLFTGTLCGRRHVAFFLAIFVNHWGFFSSVFVKYKRNIDLWLLRYIILLNFE